MKTVFRNNLAIFLSLLAVIIMLVFFFRHNNKPMQNMAHTMAEPGANFFSAFGFWFNNKFSFVTSIGRLKGENEDLLGENLKLKAQLALLKDVKGENETLRQEIKLAPRSDYNLQAAMVMGKDLSQKSDVIYIDKGFNQGLHEGMAVIVGEGVLVGKVLKANANDSSVEMILNRDSRVNAEIEEVGEKGIVRGDYGTSVVLDMIPQTVEVKPGDTVVTSGLGNTLPRGLLIGYIKESVPTADQLFQRASLVLPVQPQKLRMVWVIKG